MSDSENLDFDQLVSRFGSAKEIPDDDLYEYINHPIFRQNLSNLTELGDAYLETITKSPVGTEVRRRAKSDLFFLAHYFTWETSYYGAGRPISENLLLRETHQRLCDFFVKKDDTKSIAQQDWRKNREILWPRGGFKSSINVADVVQWILNFPDIRILYITAEDELASAFVNETKGCFSIKDNLSLMNLFFPEFCLTEKDMKKESSFEFTCPVWKRKLIKRREPTVSASSIGATNSGPHYEVLKADDVVSNRNSTNEVQCKKTIRDFRVVRKMLRPFGYCDKIGTRYADEDMYGEDIRSNIGDKKEERGPGWEIIDNISTGFRLLIGRAWQIRPDAQDRLAKNLITYDQLKEEDYDILLPKILSYPFLRKEQRDDESVFEGQYNQNPISAGMTVFDMPLLLKNTVPSHEMPLSGPISHTWDFAFSDKKGRDYTTACSAMWNDKGKCFIHDLLRKRHRTPTEKAKAIVEFAQKWRPFIIGIEEAGGSKLLEPAIQNEAIKTGDPRVIDVCMHIDWIPNTTQNDAKRTRMSMLHPWLSEGNLKFANYLPELTTLYDEFTRCMGSHHHDDIPDVISHQPRYAPRMFNLILKKELHTYSTLDAGYNLLYGPWLNDGEMPADAFGRLGMGAPPPLVQLTPEPEQDFPTGNSEMPNILGSGVFG